MKMLTVLPALAMLLSGTAVYAAADAPPAPTPAAGAEAPPHGGPGGPGHHMPKLDTDNDGKVTKAEFLAGMEEKFNKIDANKDGVLTEDERPKWHHKRDKPKPE